MFHDLSCLVHDLQGTQLHVLVVGEHKDNIGSDVLSFLLHPSSEPLGPLGPHGGAEASQKFCAQHSQQESPAGILHCTGSKVAKSQKNALVAEFWELGCRDLN